MEDHIKKIEGLIAENQAMTPRTPWLDISLGALRTAIEHGKEHAAALARLNATGPKPPEGGTPNLGA